VDDADMQHEDAENDPPCDNLDPCQLPTRVSTSNGWVLREDLSFLQLQQTHHSCLLAVFEQNNGHGADNRMYQSLWDMAEKAAQTEVSQNSTMRRSRSSATVITGLAVASAAAAATTAAQSLSTLHKRTTATLRVKQKMQ
jgi:hypothetical protein